MASNDLFSKPLSQGFTGIGALGDGIANAISPATSTTNSNASQNQDFYSNPVVDPYAKALMEQIIKQVGGNLFQDQDLSGFESNSLKNNNAGFDSAQKALQQTLASRGLTYSPVAATAPAQLDTQRIGAGIGIRNQMPLLKQQLFQNKINQALQTFSANPYGSRGASWGNTAQHSETTSQPAGGLLGGIFQGIGALGGLAAV